jgi:diguanylate cyclase (GGDEF)-like protein
LTDVAPQLDLLTGAWRRDFFEAQLGRAVSESHRQRAPFGLLYLNIDDLQEHNDVNGYPAVDAALSEVASTISEVLDGRGPIGRVEGGAFAVYLAGFTLEDSLAIAEQIRRRMPRLLAAGKSQLTVSVGVAALREGEPWGNLLEAAEKACLKAKQGGRDIVVPR